MSETLTDRHARTRRRHCEYECQRSARGAKHLCDRLPGHNEALCRCACGLDFVGPERTPPTTALEWLAVACLKQKEVCEAP